MILWFILFALITIVCYWLIYGGGAAWLSPATGSWLAWMMLDGWAGGETWIKFVAWVIWFVSLGVFIYGMVHPEFRHAYVGS